MTAMDSEDADAGGSPSHAVSFLFMHEKHSHLPPGNHVPLTAQSIGCLLRRARPRSKPDGGLDVW